jgi:hypothetical protein
MAIYKVKRFGKISSALGGAVLGACLGTALVGSPFADKSEKTLGRAMGVGALGGAIGGAYLGYKMHKDEEREKKERQLRNEQWYFPTKSMEKDYDLIIEFGGLPKEYYNALQIFKKIQKLPSIPSWGDQDEYAFFNVMCLGEIEEWIENGEEVENIPIICLGYQSTYMDISYNPKTKKWIDLGYNKVIGTGNLLKNYILKWFNEELKNLRIDLKKLNQGDEEYDMWKEVEKFYEDQIKIIQQSPF